MDSKDQQMDAGSGAYMDSISQGMSQNVSLGGDKLEFFELQTNQDFKTKICLPYFKDIYKDLQERSDNP